MRYVKSLAAQCCFLIASLTSAAQAQDYEGWKTYGGDQGNSHYSSLNQVNRDNVGELQLAWSYHSAAGAELPSSSELQINPIVIDGVLYGRNPLYNVFALDADTGNERWTFSPPAEHVGLSNMRGLSYWPGNEELPARIFFTTGHFLMALDADKGHLLKSFGQDGRVDLRQGLGRNIDDISVNAPSPGVIFDNLIIMGSAVTETSGAAPGDIRAYDVRSGDLVWTFHTIPQPGEFGYDTWPKEAWKTAGGANAWAGMSIDEARGIVYVPTGSPTPDFDGSSRHGANLFSNTVIALDARSGKRLWHYQAVHHDLWDRDLSSAPTLVDIEIDGKTQAWLAQASKQGVVYLLDRETGQAVFPIEEVPVPASDIPGQSAYPTQPKVTLPEPFTRQSMGPEDLTDINPEAHAYAKEQWQQVQDFAYMRPPGLKPSVLFPGFYGGANWGGGAYDPESGLYYINAMEAPNLVQMEAIEVDKGSELGLGQYLFREQCSGCHGVDLQGFYPYAPALTGIEQRLGKREAHQVVAEGKGRMMPFSHLNQHERDAIVDYVFAHSRGDVSSQSENVDAEKETRYVFAGYKDFVDQRYYPAVKPPWGTLTAIDLASGKRRWQIPLGEYEELTKEGVAPTGTRNFGGPVVTAGGLLIIAATSDEKLRIFDKTSGELLWQYQLPAAGYATPSTYMHNGRQYIVITCSGGKLGTATGDAYLAFALPQP
ncbi:PQQ-binding-like beta-propeller repeat protein [Parahaliea sp. F7430]|uniref:PQQ-binding-like beta-propeller repeat protein n=1 Tax=Sediminihaliea albiluteola TaxID=2758564 RepID=A0A7W2TTZ3_9GAMM|nr:PQQ-binding-like beta-propeller repeat protein [Sediminihaliea albiluteola]MBA6411916.1 PQQ-binding-like beta-propeller repeat protein [Sediminihaliea albiluteola]